METTSDAASVLLALGIVLILEGLAPFISPTGWREAMRRIAAFRDGQIRFVGLGSIVAGIVLVLVFR